MADDKKKSKIDLKARLGKSSMSGASGAGVPVPLPVPGAAPGTTPIPDGGDGAAAAAPAPQRTPSVKPPVGIAPPPGLSPGIPVPPFAQQKQAPAPKPTAVQQTIKVEESEVIHHERKKAQKKIALYGAGLALVGIVIGYVIGGAKANSDTGAKAVKTAGELGKEVKDANEKLQELNTKLGEAAEGLFKTKQYPEQAAKDIASLVIAFDAETLGVKLGGVAMPTKFIRPLVVFSAKIKDVTDTKNKLGNALGNVKIKEGIEKYWKEEKEPVFNYSVVFAQDGQKGTLAELVPNKEPFAVGKDWPGSYTILQVQRSQQGVKQAEKKANRWVKDALTGGDPIAIPVAPASVAQFSTEKSLNELYAQLLDLKKTIEGNKEDPQDTGGLLKDGETLADDLRKASLAR